MRRASGQCCLLLVLFSAGRIAAAAPEPPDELKRRLQRGDSVLLEAGVFDPLTELPPAFAAGRTQTGVERAFLVQFQRALTADPTKRYQTAGEMRVALDKFATDSGIVSSATSIADWLEALFGNAGEPWLGDESQNGF